MNNRTGLLISIYFIYFIYSQPNYVRAYDQPDLYSQFDNVIRLNSTSFIPTVYHQNKNITYMVQFYNTFCGHCQLFSPVYKDLATRAKNWTSVVRIAGVDCSKDENLITCSENNIQGYPTILIFPPNSRPENPQDTPLNLRSLNIGVWTVDDIEEAIIDYVANLSSTRTEYPLAVDAMKPVSVQDFRGIKRLYPKPVDQNAALDYPFGIQDLIFVVEEEKSYLGKNLILEYFRINHKLELRRILLSNRALLETLMSREDFAQLDQDQPLLLRLSSDDNVAQVLVRIGAKSLTSSQNYEKHDYMLRKFKAFFENFYSIELREADHNYDQSLPLSNPNPADHTNDQKGPISQLEYQHLLDSSPAINRRVFAIDLLKGISYMITHEIRIKGNLSTSEFTTVRNLLNILGKYLPLDEWDPSLSKFINSLKTRLDNNRVENEKYGMTAQELRESLDSSGAEAIRLKYNEENWFSCMQSDRQHKGYTCSLWLLFHSLTVGEYIKAAPVRKRPTMVLYTMRDYITKFLGCTVCSSNFEEESKSLESVLSARNSSVLWLWSTHNQINQRLNTEKPVNEQKSLVDVIFPSPELCVDCIKDPENIGKDGATLENIVWNLNNVLRYILDIYKPSRIISPKGMADMIQTAKDKLKYDMTESNSSNSLRRISNVENDLNQSEKWNIHSIISTSDISLCLFLYLACIIIVAIVCVALNPKWKRFKTK